jgi:lipopolysaccharide export LptBFGC system permease protein LptF
LKLLNYIQRELLVDFVFAVGGMFVLCLPGIAVSAVHKLSGVPMSAILAIVPILFANLMPYMLPLGYLLAVVVTYGRLAAENEWTAILMAGIHPLRLVLPAVPLALILGAGSHYLVSETLPDLRRREKSATLSALRDTITNLSPGRTELHLGKFNLIAGYREGDEFLEAVIHIPARAGASAKTLAARRVRFGFEDNEMIVYLTQARAVHGALDVSSERTVLRLNLDELQSDATRGFTSMRYQPSSELREQLKSVVTDDERAELIRFEIHQRGAIATTYLMFLVLGMPIGLLLRSGTRLGALSVAVGFALLYYVLSMRLGKQLAANHVLPPLLCAWAVNIAGFVAGLVLLRKALKH